MGVFYDGRIIMVLPTDPKLHLKKVGFSYNNFAANNSGTCKLAKLKNGVINKL